MSLETREIKLFGVGYPGISWDIPAVPEKFEKKMLVFNFWPLLLRTIGFLVSQHGQLGAIPPPPFLSFPPLESM